MENTYRTTEVAKIIGIHPDTARLYEDLELIPRANRLSNGYRILNDCHIEQFNLVRTALKVEILQNGLRKKMINIIKLSAKGEFEEAIICTSDYIDQVKNERRNAEGAIETSRQLLLGVKNNEGDMSLTRKQTAEYLNTTINTLRDWETNGLFSTKRKENGYRVYTSSGIKKLKIIRTLRCANYPLAPILHVINAIPDSSRVDIKKAINTPDNNEDIITAFDKLLTSLGNAEKNTSIILKQSGFVNNRFSTNSPF